MFVYKFFETVNNFYYLLMSHLDDQDTVLEHFEHACAHKNTVDVNKYLNETGWDVVGIKKSTVTPIDMINNNLGNDEHCMNVSEKNKEF